MKQLALIPVIAGSLLLAGCGTQTLPGPIRTPVPASSSASPTAPVYTDGEQIATVSANNQGGLATEFKIPAQGYHVAIRCEGTGKITVSVSNEAQKIDDNRTLAASSNALTLRCESGTVSHISAEPLAADAGRIGLLSVDYISGNVQNATATLYAGK